MKKIAKYLLIGLLTITIILEIFYSSLSNSITEKKIKESIKENLLTGFIYDNNGNKTDIFNTILKLTKLDEDTIIKLMNNETADEIITDIINSIYNYNLTGDEKEKYTKTEIIDIVESNIDKVLSEIKYYITKDEREEVIEYTKNNTEYILNVIYQTNIGDYRP